MPDIGGLQLLPETRRKIEVKIPGRNRPIVFVSVLVAIVVALYVGLGVYKGSILRQISDVDKQLTELEASRDKKSEQDLLALQKQLSVVGSALDSHLFWSNAFTKIQGLILPQVQFLSFNAEVAGQKITVRGFAANYTTMARQIAALYPLDSITDLILNKVASHPTGRVEFTMQISFDTKKLLIPNTE